MLRNLCVITFCFGLSISSTACDVVDESDITGELELDDELESLAPAELEPQEFVDEEPVSSMFECASIDESPGDLAAPGGPLEAPPIPPGDGCGSSWIVYGTWQYTTGCGGCYISGTPGRKQIKFDQMVNQCGVQSTIMHERCVVC
jgi:hypothetical protein